MFCVVRTLHMHCWWSDAASMVCRLLPALTKHEASDLEMEMVALPARHRGLPVDNPFEDSQNAGSLECTNHLAAQIATGGSESLESIRPDQATMSAVRILHRVVLSATAAAIQGRLPQPQQWAKPWHARRAGPVPWPPSLRLSTVPTLLWKLTFMIIFGSGIVALWKTCEHPVPVAQGFQLTMYKFVSCRDSSLCDTMLPPTTSRPAWRRSIMMWRWSHHSSP